MAEALAIIFLVLGIACQFMLTLQKFTAGIQGIVCLIVSIALCVYTIRRHSNEDDTPTEPYVIAALAALMIVVHAVQLPHNYTLEQQFHRVLENAREIERRQQLEEQPDAAKK